MFTLYVNLLLKVDNLLQINEGIVQRLLIEEFQNENTKTPNVNFPGLFILVDILEPESVEVFALVFEAE